jgi:CO/xanthine dehydrogenase Mo-binding subunit
VDADAKVAGSALYVDDLSFTGMLHAALVFPKLPHARLVRIDPSRALGISGVHAVLTAEEFIGKESFVMYLGDNIIKDGIKADDRIVVNGLARVRPGQKVTPQEQGAMPPMPGGPPATRIGSSRSAIASTSWACNPLCVISSSTGRAAV